MQVTSYLYMMRADVKQCSLSVFCLYFSLKWHFSNLVGGFVLFLCSRNKYSSMEQNFKKNAVAPALQEPAAPDGAAVMGDAVSPEVTSSTENLNKMLKAQFGEDFDINDKLSQDLLVRHIALNREQNERLALALEQDPRLAQMLVDMVEGKRNAHSAVARYFGRGFVNVDEDSPEFEEMMMADEERKNEVMRLANDRREYENNLQQSLPVIEAFCKEKGYDSSDFMDNVWEKLIFPIMAGVYSTDVCTMLDHAITYERDVEDAFAAGDIKGRNASIQRMKEDFGDGLPKGMNSVAPDAQQKRPKNSLIEKALGA